MAESLRISRTASGVVTLTLALPERRNAMTAELTDAWVDAIRHIGSDTSVRAVVVTGEGPVFCSGGDLSWIEQGATGNSPASIRDRMQPFYKEWLSVRDLEVPVLAAINGHAIGAGLCLALACDLRWAVPDARLAAPFANLGMHPGMAASYLLTEAVGVVRARELLYTGRSVQGDEAVSWGLLNGVVESHELVKTVQEIAEDVAAAAPLAIKLTKTGLRRGSARTFEEALAWEAIAQPVTMASDDFQESLDARREKRRPKYKG